MKVDVYIDQFTPCLLNNATGQLVESHYLLVAYEERRSLGVQWNFDWTDSSLDECQVYKLIAEGDTRIQGLVAMIAQPQNRAVYLRLAESAPHNIGRKKEYDGVGGHLFAVASQKSLEQGYGGFVYFEAKNRELVQHYADKFGAFWSGLPYEYSMFIDEEAAAVLLTNYTLVGGE